MEPTSRSPNQANTNHPALRDPKHRERREEIAHLAADFSPNKPIANVDYTLAEHALWSDLCSTLRPLHARLVHPEVLHYARELTLPTDELPQFQAVNRSFKLEVGFRLEPLAGPVSAKEFLVALSEGRLIAPQFVRHAAQPFFSPESDVVHALIGHVPALLHPDLSDLYRRFGAAARNASDERLVQLERVFWWTMQYGLVTFDGTPRAFGAALLSSAQELQGFGDGPELLPMDLEVIASTPFDPTTPTPRLFVAPDWDTMRIDLESWL